MVVHFCSIDNKLIFDLFDFWKIKKKARNAPVDKTSSNNLFDKFILNNFVKATMDDNAQSPSVNEISSM